MADRRQSRDKSISPGSDTLPLVTEPTVCPPCWRPEIASAAGFDGERVRADGRAAGEGRHPVGALLLGVGRHQGYGPYVKRIHTIR